MSTPTYKKLNEEGDKTEEAAIKETARLKSEKKLQIEETRKTVMANIQYYMLPVTLGIMLVFIVRSWWHVRALQSEDTEDRCACSLPDSIPVERINASTTDLRPAMCEEPDRRAPYWMLPMMFAVKKFMNSLVMGDDYLKENVQKSDGCFGEVRWICGGSIKTIFKVVMLVVAGNTFVKDWLNVWETMGEEGMVGGLECFALTWSLSANVAAMVAVLFSLPDTKVLKHDLGGPEYIVFVPKQGFEAEDCFVYAYSLAVLYGFPLVIISVCLLLPPLIYAVWLTITLVWWALMFCISMLIACIYFVVWGIGIKIIWTFIQKALMSMLTVITLFQWKGCSGWCCHLTDEVERNQCEWDDFWAWWQKGWWFWLDLPTGSTGPEDTYPLFYIFYCVLVAYIAYSQIELLYDTSHNSRGRMDWYACSWIAVVAFPCFLNFYVPISVRWFFMGETPHEGLDNVYNSRSLLTYLSYTASLLDGVGVCAFSVADECVNMVKDSLAMSPFKTFMQTFVDMLWTWI